MAHAQSGEASAEKEPARSAEGQATVAKEGTEKEAEKEEAAEPKTDFTLLVGSDFVRPGSLPRANLSIGAGHVFEVLKKDPLGEGVTLGYVYENTGTHGFFHTNFGEHTELLGQMRDFKLGHQERVAAFTWIQAGISSLTGDEHVHNRFSTSETLGVKFHLNRSNAIWVMESYNKVVTVPWYTFTSIGYTYSR